MDDIINGNPHIPIEEAARELKTTRLRLLMLIRHGVIKGCQVGEDWYVETGSMACFSSYESDPVKHGGCKGSCSSGGCGAGN